MAKNDIVALGRKYWNHGPGAALVNWPAPGAMTRCHALVMEHAEMTSDQAWGYCAERHHDVTGKWPIHDGKKRDEGDDMAESARTGEQTRSAPFEIERADGLTLSGYAAVFDTPVTIQDYDGEFEEMFTRGAFAATIAERTPALMFEHGRHPLIGTMPLGVIETIREDDRGLYVEARLTDNWLIQPVRDAIRDGAVSGMSYRFSVPEGGDVWDERRGQLPRRTVNRANLRELGPVVFPAYELTTASVRSRLEQLPVVGEAGGATDITAGSDTRGADGSDPRAARDGEARQPSLEAEARDRLLHMKGIIRG